MAERYEFSMMARSSLKEFLDKIRRSPRSRATDLPSPPDWDRPEVRYSEFLHSCFLEVGEGTLGIISDPPRSERQMAASLVQVKMALARLSMHTSSGHAALGDRLTRALEDYRHCPADSIAREAACRAYEAWRNEAIDVLSLAGAHRTFHYHSSEAGS